MLLMGLGIVVVHFSVSMHQPQTPSSSLSLSSSSFHRFSTFCNSLGFPCCRPSTRRPSCGIGSKSQPLSSSLSLMDTHLHVSQELESSPSLSIGQHDLLIVGPGVLGRLVAHQWREVVVLLNYLLYAYNVLNCDLWLHSKFWYYRVYYSSQIPWCFSIGLQLHRHKKKSWSCGLRVCLDFIWVYLLTCWSL